MYSGLRQALTEILSSSLIGGHRTPFKSKGTQVCVAQLHLMQKKREKNCVFDFIFGLCTKVLLFY